jgi:hypothetical protein
MGADMLKEIGMIAGCSIAAPLAFMNIPPLLESFKVVNVSVREAQDFSNYKFADGSELVFDHGRIQHVPKRTIIEYKTSKSGGWITIFHDDLKISCNDGGLFSEPYGGSGMIGVALLGLPGLIVASPLLVLNSLVWGGIEMSAGMNRYQLNVYLKLQSQLDPETRDLLKRALQKKMQSYV